MAIPTGADQPRNVRPPVAPQRADAVVYDWDLTTDALTWADNVAEVLRGLPPEAFANGATLAGCEANDGGPSRQSSLLALALSGECAAPYQAAFALQGRDGERLEIVESGRWFYDANGRPTRAHGLMRVVRRRPGPIVEAPPPGLRAVDALSSAELIDALIARARTRRAAGAKFAIAVVSIEGEATGLEARTGDAARRLARSLRADETFGRLSPSRLVALIGSGRSAVDEVRLQQFAEALNAQTTQGEEGRRPCALRVGFAISAGCGPVEDTFWTAGRALAKARRVGSLWACVSGEGSAHSGYAGSLAAAAEAPITLHFRPLTPFAPDAAPIHRVHLDHAPSGGERRAHDQAVTEHALAKLIARRDLTLAVNLALETLGDAGFVAFLTAALRGWPELARRLVIESESALPREPMAAFRAVGARVALTGFGGRGWQPQKSPPPADILTIDGALIQSLARSSEDRSHVRALIGHAQSIGVTVAAEWVDDAEAFRLLGLWGCDYAEGKAAGEPVEDIPLPAANREAAA